MKCYTDVLDNVQPPLRPGQVDILINPFIGESDNLFTVSIIIKIQRNRNNE